MENPINLLTDPLADAPLTQEQRTIWENVRSELIIARERLSEMEAQFKAMESFTHDDSHAHTILTRPEFNREAARMLAFDERYGGISSVLYIDIENLPDIHRDLGKSIADNVIRVVCDSLAKHVRSSDIIGRLATDEFGVMLARCDKDAAWHKGEALISLLQHDLRAIPGLTIKPIINYGAYTFNENESAVTGLQRAAENITRTEKKDP